MQLSEQTRSALEQATQTFVDELVSIIEQDEEDLIGQLRLALDQMEGKANGTAVKKNGHAPSNGLEVAVEESEKYMVLLGDLMSREGFRGHTSVVKKSLGWDKNGIPRVVKKNPDTFGLEGVGPGRVVFLKKADSLPAVPAAKNGTKDTSPQAFLQAFAKKKSFKARDVATRFNVDTKKASNLITHVLKRELIERVDRGVYRVR